MTAWSIKQPQPAVSKAHLCEEIGSTPISNILMESSEARASAVSPDLQVLQPNWTYLQVLAGLWSELLGGRPVEHHQAQVQLQDAQAEQRDGRGPTSCRGLGSRNGRFQSSTVSAIDCGRTREQGEQWVRALVVYM